MVVDVPFSTIRYQEHDLSYGDWKVTTITQAIMPEHETAVRDLFGEYLRWVCPKIYQEYRAVFDAESMIVHDMEIIDMFQPPKGILLLSYEDGLPSGCACTRTIGEEIAELKRMYVRPQYRGKGIGSKLVQESMRQVGEMGYSTMRLDSARFMSDVHRILSFMWIQRNTSLRKQ